MSQNRARSFSARSGLRRASRPGRTTLALGLLAALGGCVQDRPIRLALSDEVARPSRSVVIFFPDGMDLTRVGQLLAEGKLPHIEKRFVHGGVEVEHAISSLPSVTLPNCSSLITGRFPGHHGIMGTFWFDRRTFESHDYMSFETYRTMNEHLTAATLYDLLDDHHTANIQDHTRRGVTYTIDNPRMLYWTRAFGRYLDADRYVGQCFEEVARTACRTRRWPTVILTYYPGVDDLGHRYGVDSREYADALVNVDAVVGRVGTALDEAGLGGSTYFVLVSDHSVAPVAKARWFDLLGWLVRACGLRVRSDPIAGEGYVDRLAALDSYDVVAKVDAGREAMIHLRGRLGWSFPVTADESLAWVMQAPSVVDLPAVEAVLLRAGADRARVLNRRGSAIVERQADAGERRYRLVEYEGDPLGYRAVPGVWSFVAAGWHGSRDWLAATARAGIPDLVPQVVELFDSPRTGDVVIMAAEDWAFYTGEYSGHGSCVTRDMRIPLFFSGPDLPGGTAIPVGRLVDVMPTVLGLLGEEHRLGRIAPIDGISLAQELRDAKPRTRPDRGTESGR